MESSFASIYVYNKGGGSKRKKEKKKQTEKAAFFLHLSGPTYLLR